MRSSSGASQNILFIKLLYAKTAATVLPISAGESTT